MLKSPCVLLKSLIYFFPKASLARICFIIYIFILITGLPYGNPSRKMGRFLRFIFRVGKSLACHSPAKWCLCA